MVVIAMEFINTCSLGLHLTPEDQKHASQYPWLTDESQVKIALCLSLEGRASREDVLTVHQELLRIMLERRRASLDWVIETINGIMLEEERSHQDIKDDEKAFQILVSRAMDRLDKLKGHSQGSSEMMKEIYLNLCQELENIKAYLPEVPSSFHFFDGQADEGAIRDVVVQRPIPCQLEYDLRLTLRTVGRSLWNGRISYENPYNLTDVGKEIRKIDSILANLAASGNASITPENLPSRLTSLIDRLADLQEFPKPLTIIVHRGLSKRVTALEGMPTEG